MDETSVNVPFDVQVHSLIKGLLKGGETIFDNVIFEGIDFYIDSYLPEGCSALSIPSRAVLSCKEWLLFDTIDRCVQEFHELKERHEVNYYLLIIKNKPVSSYEIKLPEGFLIRFFDDLVEASKKERRKTIEEYNVIQNTEDVIVQRIKKAQAAARLGKSTFFLGAGVSIGAGLPNWGTLLKRILSILNKARPDLKMRYSVLDNDAKRSSLIMARYIESAFKNEDEFKRAVKDSLYQVKPKTSKLIEVICSIIAGGQRDIDSVITYNYDDCIEQELRKIGCKFNSITEGNRVSPGAFPVFHVHGYIPNSGTSSPSDFVLTEDSYHAIYKESYHWSNIEQLHSLGNTTCFFIGLSMLDPNLRRLIDHAADRDRNAAYHYAFLCRDDFEDIEAADLMFLRLGVNVLWIDNYSELPAKVKEVFS